MLICCKSCTKAVRYAVVFVIVLLWEALEYAGNKWEWSEPQIWWEHETICNRVCDIVIGMVGFALVDSTFSDRRYEALEV